MAAKVNRTLPAEETAVFCDQVAMVLKSGIPLYDGVRTICAGRMNGPMAAGFKRLSDKLTETGSLYEAVVSAGIFPGYMTGMIKTGEMSGKLDTVTEKLAAYYRREARIRSSIQSAVVYPVTLIGIMAVVIAILTIVVLPVFSRVYASLGAEACSTAAAMTTGVTVGRVMIILISVILVTGLIIYILMKTKARSGVMESLTATLPALRRTAELMSAERFASVSAAVLSSGLDVSAALDTAPEVITDARALRRVEKIKKDMQEGASFSDCVARSGLFEPLHSEMITVGASSGQMDTVMERLAVTYDEKANDAVQNAVSLIEPTLIAVLCVAVGGIMLSVMLPLINILAAIG